VNISASVKDKTTSVGIQGVNITLTAGAETFTGTTGSAGGCTLNNVPVGSYTVTATKTGYTEYTGDLTVTSETTSLTIELEEE